ncbi:MAG: phosphosulfolactate synthase [Flavobacteriales bacterium]|nr:phosphosulfolactate synthase [Flavobacteriales bacterium]
MMGSDLPFIPERPDKPRSSGITMVMDKGLSLRQAEDMIASAGHLTDFVKLGFGTSFVGKDIKEKVKLYRDAGIRVYLGGTLFEAFLIRGRFDDYRRMVRGLGIDTVEVSDGCISLDHGKKCELIQILAREFLTLSEVGSKESGIIIHPNKWKRMMLAELDAGSWKVIAEARESGTVGIYRPNGTAHVSLINKILGVIPADKVLWEAPQKEQQVWFINLLGANVNLGNIAPTEIIPLETLRVGLRGDTFFNHLPADIDANKAIDIPKDNKMKDLTVEELKQKMDAKQDFQLIDLRENWELEVCSMGGTHIPMAQILERIGELRTDVPVIMHCRSGGRSSNIVSILESRFGRDNLYNLKGGILAWADRIDKSMEKY